MSVGISNALPPISGGATPPAKATRSAEDQAAAQLIADLKSGNLSGAQQDYVTLSSFGPGNSGPFTNSTMKGEFKALGQDLQNGNLKGADADATKLAAQQLTSDKAVASADYQSGNMAAYQQAMSNMKGDQWAIFGSDLVQPPAGGSALGASSGINVQA